MSKIKRGPGVFQHFDGKITAEIGLKVLGEFKSIPEAATAYNNHVAKVFTFPVYNKDGQIPQAETYEEPVTEESPVEFNKPLKDYLKQKELEVQQEKLEEKVNLDQVLDTLKNE